jgi:uncharacterized protein
MSAHRHSESPSMAAAAMPLPELDRWLQDRADRHPVATSIPMLDGYVAAIVAGPVSIDPPDWICPLLAIDADAFNHGGTPELAAICAVARRHNDISRVLSTTPERFEPMHRRKPNGEVDPRPWCRGDQGRPLLGPKRKSRTTKEFLRNAHADIPAVVEAMRQYWMRTRYARAG